MLSRREFILAAMEIRNNTNTPGNISITNRARFEALEESQLKLYTAMEEVTTSLAQMTIAMN